MDDSRAKSVSQLLSAFFDEKTLQRGEQYLQFSRSWRSIVGDRLADHSKPADIRHGILLVETDHSGWIQLLQLKQERILGEIKKRYPELEIHGLAFRIGYGERDQLPAHKEITNASSGRDTPELEEAMEREKLENQKAEIQNNAEQSQKSSKCDKTAENSQLPDFLLKKFEHIRQNIEKR